MLFLKPNVDLDEKMAHIRFHVSLEVLADVHNRDKMIEFGSYPEDSEIIGMGRAGDTLHVFISGPTIAEMDACQDRDDIGPGLWNEIKRLFDSATRQS